MSDFSDEMVTVIRQVVYRQVGVAKSAETGAVLEAVLESAVRPLCDTIDRFRAHSEYVDVMLRALSTPDTGLMSGPRRTEDFRPEEWPTRRIRTGARYE